MSGLRFKTARAVFEAFPTLEQDVRAEPSDDPPARYLQALSVSGTPEDGVAFSAYVLDRREAVWWACQCVRLVMPGGGTNDASLQAAETWVCAPNEENRLAALRLGTESDRRRPTTWLSLAAGWSGGNIAPDGSGAVPTQPYYTARAARVAVLSGLAQVPAGDRADRLRRCLDGAVKLMAAAQAP